MLKVTVKNEEINLESHLHVCIDVSKEKLNLFSEVLKDGKTIKFEDEIDNKKKAISKFIDNWQSVALKNGKENLLIVCEPTGKYHKSLMQMARKKGCKTAFVFGNSVNRMGVVESNDTGKTDLKDPRIISLLVKMQKTFKDREFNDDYQRLRLMNKLYDEEEKLVVQCKTRIESIMIELFPDWSLRNELFYGKLAVGLWKVYKFNPHMIISGGHRMFYAVAKKYSPRTHRNTLEKIWQCAESSSLHTGTQEFKKVLETRLGQLFEDIKLHNERKEELKDEMLTIYRTLDEAEKFDEFITRNDFMMARLIAETGSLSDFKHYRQLLKYTGLNLREKSSGKYVGELKITKRGRSLFRKVLWRIIMSMIGQKGTLFYARHKKKKKELGSGNKAVIAHMRFFVKSMFGVYKSKQSYDPVRLFIGEGAYKPAA